VNSVKSDFKAFVKMRHSLKIMEVSYGYFSA
jgi:hypothetical protein